MKEDPSPCYYCKEHRPYCRRDCTHGWKEWKEAHEKRREEIGKKKRSEGLLIAYRKDVHERVSKHKRYHGSKEKGAKS